jgi:hypothetical protein
VREGTPGLSDASVSQNSHNLYSGLNGSKSHASLIFNTKEVVNKRIIVKQSLNSCYSDVEVEPVSSKL